jgi:hypothetical protein
VAVSLIYMPIMTFRDQNDNPVPFAKVFSYQALTTTPLSLFADPGGVTPLSNPAIADAGGRLVAYGTVGLAYKINILDQLSVQVPGWPIDQIVIVPNGSPTLIASPEPTVAVSDTVTDPGEVGTESLATSEQGMWERIKFVIREMKGTPSWRTTTVTKYTGGDITTFGLDANHAFPATGTSSIQFQIRVPYDWHSGGIAFYIQRRASVVGGAAIMTYALARLRDGATAVNVSSGTFNFVPVDGSTHATSLTFTFGQFQAGDVLRAVIARLGSDAGDDMAAVNYDGHYFEYTAYASR